jgi:hypothetical protein
LELSTDGKTTTKPSFSTPSPETLSAIEAEDTAAELRQACYGYEQKKRDLETKFETALSNLRDQYLQRVAAIQAA